MTHLRNLGKFSLTESLRAHQNVGDLEFVEEPISIEDYFSPTAFSYPRQGKEGSRLLE